MKNSLSMGEIKKVWYRDLKFICLTVIILLFTILVISSIRNREIKSCYEEQEIHFNNTINEMSGNGSLPAISVDENKDGVYFSWYKGNKLKHFCVIVIYQLVDEFYFNYMSYFVGLISAIVLICFMTKWILQTSGRRKEFQSMLPVRQKNIWLAEFAEGMFLLLMSCLIYTGIACTFQHSMYLSCQRTISMEEPGILLSDIGQGRLLCMGVLGFLYMVFLLGILFFIRELTDKPIAMIGLYPLSYYSAPLLLGSTGMVRFLLAKIQYGNQVEEIVGQLELIDLWPWNFESFINLYDYLYEYSDHDWYYHFSLIVVITVLVLTILLFLVSYLLHGKKDVSGNKVFRFLVARFSYMILIFCFFFIAVYPLSIPCTIALDWVLNRKKKLS